MPEDKTPAPTGEAPPTPQSETDRAIAAVPGLSGILEGVTRALQESTQATREMGALVKEAISRIERLEGTVYGSNPPTSPPPDAFPLTEAITGVHDLAKLAKGDAEAATKKGTTLEQRLDAMQAELRLQSSAMGIGRRWFEFLATPAGRLKAIAVAGTVAASVGAFLHFDAGMPRAAAAAAPTPIIVVVPASPSASATVLPPPSVSR